MDPSKLTFSALIDLMTNEAAQGKVSQSAIPNLRSALLQFCAKQGLALDRPVGHVMRSTYYDQVRAHRAMLLAENRPESYITNRCSLLTRWRRLVADHDRLFAVEHGTAMPFQAAILETLARYPNIKSVARGVGMPPATLKRWAEGATPSARSIAFVPRLEQFAKLSPGTLASLLPIKLPEATKRGDSSEIAYRQRLAVALREPYRLTEPPDTLREQWAALIAFKVNRDDKNGEQRVLNDDDDDTSLRNSLHRSAISTWRVRPAGAVGRSSLPWYAQIDGLYVPTAEVNWMFASQYFGWLCLDIGRGGLGLSASEACRLSNLARRSLLDAFFKWKVAKAGGEPNSGLMTFAKQVTGFCNPKTGYLTQSYHSVGIDTGLDEHAWRARCASCYRYLRDKARVWEQPGVMKVSRDSFAPIETVIEMPNPMVAIRDMVNRMVACRPSRGGTREAVWSRNVLLVKLLASNPLRELNLRTLTIASGDGAGHLRRDPDGSWRIFIPREELKNVRGAAKDRDYDRLVRSEVWPDIEQYIAHHRPLLMRAPTNKLFISERTGGPVSKKMLARCFEGLTRKFLVDCPGVGLHCMRHIVASAHVKANPNGIAIAAAVLHDKVETVAAHYARFGRHDVSRWESDVMDEPFGGMQ